MSRFTDENVPLSCGECDALCEGLTDTICHLIEAHGHKYNLDEASECGRLWVESAHIDQEEAEGHYYETRALARSIERDAFRDK